MQKGWFIYGPQLDNPKGQWTDYDPVARIEQLQESLEIKHGMKEYWKKAYRELEDKNNALSKGFDNLREQNEALRSLLLSTPNPTPTYRTPTIADIGKVVELSSDGLGWFFSLGGDPVVLYGIMDYGVNGLRFVVKLNGVEHQYRYARIKE